MLGLKTESDDMLHLDALRFIAASAVVFFHWSANLIYRGTAVDRRPIDFLTLAVDLFFIISGVVMVQVYSKRLGSLPAFGRFMQRRIARLYPLHLATFLIMLAFGLAIHALHLPANHPETYDFHQIVPNLLLLQSLPVVTHLTFNRPSWSISAEMLCYALLAAILLLYRRRWWMPAVLSVAFTTALVLITHGWAWSLWDYGYGFLRAIPPFLFGVTLGGAGNHLRRIPAPNVLLCALGCAFFAGGVLGAPRGVMLLLVYLIGISAFAADEQRRSGRMVRAIAPLGVLTYSIYMIHTLFEAPVFAVAFKKLHLHPWSQNLMVCLSFLPLLVLSYLSYMYFETPARHWISSLGVNNRRTAAGSALLDAPRPVAKAG